jgi:hypothetical protein
VADQLAAVDAAKLKATETNWALYLAAGVVVLFFLKR